MPAAHNSPGFSSFSDYLNANAGALDTERGKVLGDVNSQIDTAQGDLTGLNTEAFNQGQTAGAAIPAYQGHDIGTGKAVEDPFRQDKPPDYAADPTTLAGYGQFQTDLTKATDSSSALASGSAPGKSTWESSLLNGAGSFGEGAKAASARLGSGAFSNYLDTLGAQGQAGYQKGLAAPTTVNSYNVPAAIPGDQQVGATNSAPTYKPRHGKPGEDQP